MNFASFCLDDSPGWARVREDRLFDHQYIKVDEVEYATPNHERPVTWIVARRKSAVVVAPQLEDGRFLMILQERYPIQRAIWEFPAGQIDDFASRENQSTIEATVRRELEEETGHELSPESELIPLGYFFASQGFMDEHAYLYLARGVRPSGKGLNLDEFENILECRPFTLEEIKHRIATNEIIDANTLALFARLCACGISS